MSFSQLCIITNNLRSPTSKEKRSLEGLVHNDCFFCFGVLDKIAEYDKANCLLCDQEESRNRRNKALTAGVRQQKNLGSSVGSGWKQHNRAVNL